MRAIRSVVPVLLVTMVAGTACDSSGKPESPPAFTPAVSVSEPTSSEIPVQPRPDYRPPELWLIDEHGIGRRLIELMPGPVVGILYSTWCPRAHETLKDAIPAARRALPEYGFMGLFSDAEAEQLLEEADGRGFSASERATLKKRAEDSDVLDPEALLDKRFAIPKYRMPRDQWEKLGGSPGGLDFVCFEDGQPEPCPKALMESLPSPRSAIQDAMDALDELERQIKSQQESK